MLNRNVADDDTVAIKVHQGRRPVAVANNSSVSAARILSSAMKLVGQGSHRLADNNLCWAPGDDDKVSGRHCRVRRSNDFHSVASGLY